jgi:hypothetical protein
MTDFFRIVYVNTRSSGKVGDLPNDVKNIRDWTWSKSAHVHWSCVEPTDVGSVLDTASVVLIDWSSDNAMKAGRICKQVRGRRPDLLILILASEPGPTPMRDRFVTKNPPVVLLQDLLDPKRIVRDLDALNLGLPQVRLVVYPEQNNLTIEGLVDWVGKERLELMIQKHFGDAEKAYLKPVGGGWSEAKLCRFFVDTDEKPYFLKFFTQMDSYRRELSGHAKAKEWLGDSVVNLLIPNLAGGLVDQSDLFPEGGIDRACYPACYESASSRDRPRETFKDLYREQADDFVEKVLVRLLEILATGQPDHDNQRVDPAWNCKDNKGFCLDQKTQISILDACDDLARYCPAMYGGDKGKWDECHKLIQTLAYNQPLPAWLTEPLAVCIGHVHGDPNPRNCLVKPDDPTDVRLIDCGEYRPDGRLVSDLALIERDIKLVLMGTESNAGRFFDLDVTQLPNWCEAERYSVSRRFDYQLAYAPSAPGSIKRAYRLIERVRQRARHVCEKDSEGQHYFAALLYWTLDVLKYTAVRPTKKLLALYSAAEIVRSFV